MRHRDEHINKDFLPNFAVSGTGLKPCDVASTVPASLQSSGLTTRQAEVMALVAQGLSSRAIAERLGLRFYTVTTHMKIAYKKLGVHNRVGAAARFPQPCPHCGYDAMQAAVTASK